MSASTLRWQRALAIAVALVMVLALATPLVAGATKAPAAKPTTEVIGVSTAEDIRQNVSVNPEAIGIGPQAIVNALSVEPGSKRSVTARLRSALALQRVRLLGL